MQSLVIPQCVVCLDLSVLSVCPSVKFRYHDHIDWNKIISRLISLRFLLGLPNVGDLVQWEHP